VSKWIEFNHDNLRIGTAKAVARLMSFAQITCKHTAHCYRFITHTWWKFPKLAMLCPWWM